MVASVAFTTLVGRVGATRASVTIHLLPAVVLVTVGAHLTGRSEQPRVREHP